MTIKCNVCVEGSIVTLPDPQIGEAAFCPNCEKTLAYAETNHKKQAEWRVVDGEYNEDFGGIPVEVLHP